MSDIVERLRRDADGWGGATHTCTGPNVAALEREAATEIERLRADKDQAYLERNHLVAALARLYPSGIRATNIPGWSPDWHGCVYIDLPSGQISYHYHDSQAHLFGDLPPYTNEWDGHDKEAVHARLSELSIQIGSGHE